jgi:hypothetical protein
MAKLLPDRPSIELPERRECTFALFVDDDELRRRINPNIGRDRFRAAVRAAEQRGFPKIHPLWRGRYWPAVQMWLDSEIGAGKNGFDFNAEDGPENFNAPAR